MAGEFGNPEVVQEDVDVLLIGGGMACCGAGYEIMRWADAAKAELGIDLKIKLVDKAAMDRSGAVAQGLSAINTYNRRRHRLMLRHLRRYQHCLQ